MFVTPGERSDPGQGCPPHPLRPRRGSNIEPVPGSIGEGDPSCHGFASLTRGYEHSTLAGCARLN